MMDLVKELLPIIFGTVLTAVLGIIAYFLRRLVERLDQVENDHKDLRKEFENFKSQLPFLYVLREDWIRYQAQFDRKLDDILKALATWGKDKGGN